MLISGLPRIKITEKVAGKLKAKGVTVPENASHYDYIMVRKPEVNVDLYTFKDKNDFRLEQLKVKTNNETKKEEVQLRTYTYDKGWSGKGKISGVNQILTDSQTGKSKETDWIFYRSKDGGTVRFSRKSGEEQVDNYLRADGYITDKNGLKIRPISLAEFVDKKREVGKNFIDAPWTLKESITTKDKCATDAIQECTVVGIYGDKGLSLNHLNPSNEKNENFIEIEKAILDQIELQGKNAKAFVIGSCESDYNSNMQYLNIIDLLAVKGVPHSRLKTGDKVLYGPMKENSRWKMKHSEMYKNGGASPYEWQAGHHIIYDNGELKITNSVIDEELKKGNTDPEQLIKKSFSVVKK